MHLCIEKLISGGEGLAIGDDGKKVFVAETLPGEEVEASIVQKKGGYNIATVDSLLKASEHRIQPPCPYWGVCGGCDFQYADAPYQAACKEAIVLDNLSRLGGLQRDAFSVEPSVTGPAWNYRNRVRFHVDLTHKTVGFLRRKSSDLVRIESCPILTGRLNALLSDPKPLFEAARRLMFANHGGKTDYLEVPAFASEDEISLLDKEISITVGSKRFFVTSEVFFQSNHFLTASLGDYVASQAIGQTVMDLYSGVGTFSAFLAQPLRRLIAVEKQKQCIALAKKHLTGCEFFTDAVELWAKRQAIAVDTVVVDPPRTGLEETVPSLIASWAPKRVIYVSCNSVTLARDLQRFASEGYTTTTVKMFDLYPQTFHHEVVVVLDRREN
ncbi:class I SAM-dependent RNA methyltransferase [Sphaerochaeta globosa]|uniref:(Uracil-5)-methyltransferase n=1 Tax=Sphaerochaeta globosa (strain ATCC BAA-1886 / DSM 22777 / Buddy) TaxID=158189 RepID=F0RUY5_SPHGB|nr:class I SAM-dependent RNA methyltransferase [Sphaerochaeta globosa]ADY12636.1 (Uracil-5)-methyltransferase [Sphaerochaeta globosa str. Buddy]